MVIVCSACGETVPTGVTLILDNKGTFVMVCVECYLNDEIEAEIRSGGSF